MGNYKNNFDKNFTQIHNNLINDVRLSMKAKGLLIYLISKPDEWNFSANGISSQMNDGLSAINSTLKELENVGYLKRIKVLNKGKFVGMNYEIIDVSNQIYSSKLKDGKTVYGKTVYGKSTNGKSVNGKPTNISNTDSSNTILSNTIINNTLITNAKNEFSLPETEKVQEIYFRELDNSFSPLEEKENTFGDSQKSCAKKGKPISYKQKTISEAHKPIIEFWTQEFKPEYIFSGGKDASAIKKISTKIYEHIERTSGCLPNSIMILNWFKAICHRLQLLGAFYATADLSIINSKYNTIIELLKQTENGEQSKPTRGSIQDGLNTLRQYNGEFGFSF